MPIEIRELVIRATVAQPAASDEQLQRQLAPLIAQMVEQCLARVDERRAERRATLER